MRFAAVLFLALVAGSLGCKKQGGEKKVDPSGGLPALPGASSSAAAPANVLAGQVLERIDTDTYSYLRLGSDKGEVWAAVPKTDVANGTAVTIYNPMLMENFESKTLNRKWDKIVFGTLTPPAGAPQAAADPHAGQAGMPPMPANVKEQHAAAATGGTFAGEVKVPKAEGPDARTIEEVYAQKADLKEKPVVIHATVVKFTAAVMGKNWLHLRDGSGKQDSTNNDITATTTDTAAVGDVVTVKGTVRLDKDFGAGYAYPVIVEEASLTK